jgi:hypothetical protein
MALKPRPKLYCHAMISGQYLVAFIQLRVFETSNCLVDSFLKMSHGFCLSGRQLDRQTYKQPKRTFEFNWHNQHPIYSSVYTKEYSVFVSQPKTKPMKLSPIMDFDVRNIPQPFTPCYINKLYPHQDTKKNYFTSTSYYRDYSSTPTLVENNSGIFSNTDFQLPSHSRLQHKSLWSSIA